MVQPLVRMKYLVFFQDTILAKTLSTLCADMLRLLAAWLAVHGGHVVSEVGLMAELLLKYCAVKAHVSPCVFGGEQNDGWACYRPLHIWCRYRVSIQGVCSCRAFAAL